MGRNLFRPILFACVFLTLLLQSENSFAGRVVNVKGKKVLIVLDPSEVDSTQKGDKLFLTTPEGKKRALVMVRNIKGNKVIAQLGKGKAAKGFLTQPAAGGLAKKSAPMETNVSADEIAKEEIGSSKRPPDLRFGLQGSYGMASQSVAGVADMSGSAMGFKGLIDYSLFTDLGLRGRVGLDMFSVTGSSGATNYETNINYLTVDMLVRYNLVNTDSFGLFVHGGVGIYSPMSSELGTPQAIQEDSVSTTSLLILGAGVFFPVGSLEIFAGGEYFYFPPSESVKTSVISGKLGVLFAF